ncbi:MAG TPA: hypothetical protein VFQ65_24625 [Kofleriaceae bacterium]|nr:hypothetical protein [Kofleriaceae bacterium]
MTPLEELAVATPRDAALCKRYARRMDPWWGFVIAGAIWVVCTLAISVLATIKLGETLGYADGSTGAKVLSMILLVAGAAIAIVTFRSWRRRRLALKEKLVREGALLDMEVTGRPWGDGKTTVVDLEGADRSLRCAFNRWFLPGKGETIKVLHHPQVSHVVAFGRSGAMYSGHVRDVRLG